MTCDISKRKIENGGFMNLVELNTKNFCALYFTAAQKRHVDFEQLGKFYSYLHNHLSDHLQKERKYLIISYSDYYLRQMCYEYDYLYEMDEEQLSVKKDVSLYEIEKELGWLPIDILVESIKISNDFFEKTNEKPSSKKAPEKNSKSGKTDERTL